MNEQLEPPVRSPEWLIRVEEHVRCRLSGRVCDLQVVVRNDGLVLRGHAQTYYAKQLAQHAVMEASNLPIRANEIEVAGGYGAEQAALDAAVARADADAAN